MAHSNTTISPSLEEFFRAERTLARRKAAKYQIILECMEMLEALPDDESLMGLTGADLIARTLPKRTDEPDEPDFPIDNKSNQSGTSASSYKTAKSTQDQRRTLRFSNLPNVGPLKSFAAMRNVIKVGQIIEFSAVHNDGSVCDVSMAHGADGFRNHVRQHVLNIAGKNVIGDWAPKLKISDKLTKAIGKGTTRIVVIVGARDKIRPKHIKHDLARINGLIVLSITEPGRDVVIETHSMRMARGCAEIRCCRTIGIVASILHMLPTVVLSPSSGKAVALGDTGIESCP